MAISREKKERLVEDLSEKLSRSSALIMTDYRGLSTAELTKLRNKLRDLETGFHVVKNSLVKLAMEEAGLPWDQSLFDGPTAIGFCYEEVPGTAKVFVDFSTESKTLSVRGGLLGHELLTAEQIVELASLPSGEVLIAQVMAMISGPLVGLLNVLNAPVRDFLYLLQARMGQLGEGEA
ncbi:MAG TPA: 50S ribosomal protein L10 [Anaerolineae bacterium]|jgi:large subunit ribosomal protein L10|nr:50S ribosomal protein L10 [Anaerolineae bacterium]